MLVAVGDNLGLCTVVSAAKNEELKFFFAVLDIAG